MPWHDCKRGCRRGTSKEFSPSYCSPLSVLFAHGWALLTLGKVVQPDTRRERLDGSCRRNTRISVGDLAPVNRPALFDLPMVRSCGVLVRWLTAN
jgi:hypothetical protein